MENVKQKFLQSHYLQDDHKGFLKMLRTEMLIRQNELTLISENITGPVHLKLCTEIF